MTRELVGGCHCGAIRFALQLDDDTKLSPRRCGCSFCRKHGGLYISAPGARLDIGIASDEAVSRYAFGHKTAEFLICKTCGVFPAVTCQIDGRLYAVLNANTLNPPIEADDTDVPVADYESENVTDRLGRRRERWIGNVTVTPDQPGA